VRAANKRGDLRPHLWPVEERYLNNIAVGGSTSRLTSVLNYCFRLYFRRDNAPAFSKIVKVIMMKNKHEPKRPTAVDALLGKLKIRRFITTNYDEVLSDELKKLGIDSSLNRLTATFSELTSFA
jgi:hypothetical protein